MMNKIWDYEDFLRTPLSPPAWSLQIITLKCLKMIISNEQFIDAAMEIGEHQNLEDKTLKVLEEFVCKLYGVKNVNNIDSARYILFTRSKKIPDPEYLPPTQDALILHFDRVNVQTYEWKRALYSDYEPLDPNGKGKVIA